MASLKWTEEELHILREYYPKERTKCVGRLPGRTAAAAKRQARLHKIASAHWWTETEKYILRKYYPIEGLSCAPRLPGRSKHSIHGRAFKLGISRRWGKEEDEIIRKYYSVEGPNCRSRLNGRSSATVSQRACHLGVTNPLVAWSPEEIAIIKKYYAEEGGASCARRLGRKRESVVAKANALGIKKIRKYPIDLTGFRFGRLLVLRQGESHEAKGGKRYSRWVCECDCGKTKLARRTSLLNGHTQSCGCLAIEAGRKTSKLHPAKPIYSPEEAAFREYYGSYKSRAKTTGLLFSLSHGQAKKLMLSPCYYCGSPPDRVHRGARGKFMSNGLDRVDNSKGYTLKNCVPCCNQCNRAKSNLTAQEFIEWLSRAYRYLFGDAQMEEAV